jgi:hypothetical protein
VVRVHAGQHRCDRCYAEVWTVKRFHKAGWDNHPRVRSAATTWRQPLAWHRKAAGVRRRVFCSHLSDDPADVKTGIGDEQDFRHSE